MNVISNKLVPLLFLSKERYFTKKFKHQAYQISKLIKCTFFNKKPVYKKFYLNWPFNPRNQSTAI